MWVPGSWALLASMDGSMILLIIRRVSKWTIVGRIPIPGIAMYCFDVINITFVSMPSETPRGVINNANSQFDVPSLDDNHCSAVRENIKVDDLADEVGTLSLEMLKAITEEALVD